MLSEAKHQLTLENLAEFPFFLCDLILRYAQDGICRKQWV
jgi:hypothetical protein